ncbi:MAG: class I SAM-dependent rRNA methyltransferase [Gammaproteobacteria bacterium]|nr:class I SAM-dependent rRNA methyltransferase [Gammaproteobacteria bacterium]
MTFLAGTTLRLKKREERRLLAGHLWVFSNEIDTANTPLKGVNPGTAVSLESSTGKFLAHAYVNPASLIAARVVSFKQSQPFTGELLRQRLMAALDLRRARFEQPYYRWVHSEGDLLPGLVVDRFGDRLVVQITTAGMDQWQGEILECLQLLSGATAIQLANDSRMRELEQLPSLREWVLGEAPEYMIVQENGLEFSVPSHIEQKTGWFYDHRMSRLELRRWVNGKRVLDVYSFLGAFGLNAASAGAESVLAIDSSSTAVDAANANAVRQKVADRFNAVQDDAVAKLRSLYEENERFDVIVVDPPAFVKRKKDLDSGRRHYALVNRLALRLLNAGGIILSASCSQAFSGEQLRQVLRQAAPKEAQSVQILASLAQGADHPMHAAMPETSYLKGFIARLIK